MHSREGYFGVHFSSCWATREINTKIRLEWAHKQFITSVHALYYFLHDITNPKMTLKVRIFTHHPHVSLARFTFCWWRHNRLVVTSQWPDNCDENTWQVISNSLDIDLITAILMARRIRNHDVVCTIIMAKTLCNSGFELTNIIPYFTVSVDTMRCLSWVVWRKLLWHMYYVIICIWSMITKYRSVLIIVC